VQWRIWLQNMYKPVSVEPLSHCAVVPLCRCSIN
jgi:hypothetical protein